MVAPLRRDRLNVAEIEEVAVPLLARMLKSYGFTGADTAEDKDYDGEPVIRLTAQVQTRVPAKTVIDCLDAVRTELLRLGEERFVMFGTRRPEADETVEGDLDADEKW